MIRCATCPMGNKIEGYTGEVPIYCLWLQDWRRPEWFCSVTLSQVEPYHERLTMFIEALRTKGDD